MFVELFGHLERQRISAIPRCRFDLINWSARRYCRSPVRRFAPIPDVQETYSGGRTPGRISLSPRHTVVNVLPINSSGFRTEK